MDESRLIHYLRQGIMWRLTCPCLANNATTIKLWTNLDFFLGIVDNRPMEISLNFGDVLNSGMTLTFEVEKKVKNDVCRFLGFCTQNSIQTTTCYLKQYIFMELVLPVVYVGPSIIHQWVECCPCAEHAFECLIKLIRQIKYRRQDNLLILTILGEEQLTSTMCFTTAQRQWEKHIMLHINSDLQFTESTWVNASQILIWFQRDPK